MYFRSENMNEFIGIQFEPFKRTLHSRILDKKETDKTLISNFEFAKNIKNFTEFPDNLQT